jgi:hypothetical protein
MVMKIICIKVDSIPVFLDFALRLVFRAEYNVSETVSVSGGALVETQDDEQSPYI